MNERIKELALQAMTYVTHNPKANKLNSGDMFDEKFAELIVRECSNIVFEEGCTEDNQDCPNEELYQLSNKIEQHFGFGVEE
jgi:hypothetical protein